MKAGDFNFDLLVVGKGLSGMMAAIVAEEAGLSVALVSESDDSASSWAQGGIVYKDADSKNSDLLQEDILNAGAQLNSHEIVKMITECGSEYIEEFLIKKAKIHFDQNEAGDFDLGQEAAHSKRRILHVKDQTGLAILSALKKYVQQSKKISEFNGALIDLISSDRHSVEKQAVYSEHSIQGAYFLDSKDEVFSVLTSATILASGGYTGIFQYCTGPKNNIGAGIAAAHRAGAKTMHMEFVQFHPTVLYADEAPRGLLTEALRGEGALLLNDRGERFVDELAPRDQVSRAIHYQIAESSKRYVSLDLRNVKNLKKKFPGIYKKITEYSLDPLKDLVPVVPAAHYSLGGIWVNENGKTSVPNLWACGEVSCSGLHGANRLASMSLVEALVFGVRSARDALRALEKKEIFESPFTVKKWKDATHEVDPILLKQDWLLLRQSMWNYVGLVRSEKRLNRAQKLLVELRSQVDSFYQETKLNRSLLSLRHSVLVSTLCLFSALSRKESLGTHFIEKE